MSADITGSLFSLGWTHRDVSSHVLSAQCELGMSNVALAYMVTSKAFHIIIFFKKNMQNKVIRKITFTVCSVLACQTVKLLCRATYNCI